MKSTPTAIIAVIILLTKDCDGHTAKFSIAGNRSISDCMSGERPNDSDKYETTTEFIRRQGYEAEEHAVITKDRYILTMHRIPGPKGAPPVFLQHGIVMSSFDWVIMGKGKSLAFLLADRGYDVWMGNARGNTYSRCHMQHTTANFSFWNFSWHEMGVYDIPAEIDYVARVTKQSMTFVGFSMGTTMFYVAAIERPEVASKVKAMFSLAPVAYIRYPKLLLRQFTRFNPYYSIYAKLHGTYEFLSQGPRFKSALSYLCNLTTFQQKFCIASLSALIGFNSPQFNYTLLPKLINHTPAGTSMKCMLHYMQEVSARRFQKYDYGEKNNLMLYNSTTPPSYDVSKIQVPIGIIWSDNDYIAHPIDTQQFYDEVPNKILNYIVRHPTWNHIDYLFGINATDYVYTRLMSAMEDYR